MITATFQEGSFRDKTVLVSGGTSGIGAAIGNALAELGASVTVTGATDIEAADAQERGGFWIARAAALDVRDGAAVAAFFAGLPTLDIIRVNAIAPGWIETELTRPLREDPVRNEAIVARTPLGRWGVADDVAGTAVFLCSPAAAFVTGAIIPIDGGYLAA